MKSRPKILAYYFPNYHEDRRNAAWFGEGWTEWELVRASRARFVGHQQPREPLLGYSDEADPEVMAGQIDLAKRHGIDGFIFDFYWYEDGPYLQRALDEGFLGASNTNELEFSLMWANHDLVDIFPRTRFDDRPPVLRPGRISRRAFEEMAQQMVHAYFSRPNYTRIAGKPRFSIYELGAFIEGLGGVDEAADALAWFQELAREAGHPGVHLDAVVWGFSFLPQEVALANPADLLPRLGFDSASSYVWIHHTNSARFDFPLSHEWRTVADRAFAAYDDYHADLQLPFHPNVTAGWDAFPRVADEVDIDEISYPPAWVSDASDFRYGLELARDFCQRHPVPYREITINAWNEWTEGSYLLPDELDGYAKLEAIRDTFGERM